MQLLCALGQVQRMVGDPLEVGERVQIFADLLVLRHGHFMPCDANEAGAQCIFIYSGKKIRQK